MIAEVFRKITPIENYPSHFYLVDSLEVCSSDVMVEIMTEYSKDSFCSIEKIDPGIFFRVEGKYFSPCHMELVESNLGWSVFSKNRKTSSEYLKPCR